VTWRDRRGASAGLVLALVLGAGASAATIRFRDVTKPAGIRFNFKTDVSRGRMISTMGAGVAAADFDGDGFVDLFFTGSASNARDLSRGPCGALYRNRGDGTFEDVTARSGIRSCGWQMGAAWVDFDSDGRPDLIVSGLDATRVWHNEGDGRFRDVTRSLGIDVGRQFTIGVAAGDAFGDGRVALYFLGYLSTTPEQELTYPRFQFRMPEGYLGESGVLYRRNPDGTYSDTTASSGVDNRGGRGTGAVFFDYDGDGSADLFIANDRASNRLYHNEGNGRFRDVTEEAGAGERDGIPRAGMGIAIGDPFGSGWPDILVTNFSGQSNTYYRNVGGQLFEDATEAVGVGKPSWPFVKWGTQFCDFDNDGNLDLFVVSGQLISRTIVWLAGIFSGVHSSKDFPGDQSYRQPVVLWRNDGKGRFEDASSTAGDLASVRLCARGAIAADFDGDGRPDLAVAAISGGARLFHNETECGHAIEILPVAGSDGRTMLGTKVRVSAGGRVATQPFLVVPSYASGSWIPLHFGLGAADHADRIEVIPPAGGATVVATDVRADRLYRFRDGRLAEVRSFRR
jgi:hypothetical protein